MSNCFFSVRYRMALWHTVQVNATEWILWQSFSLSTCCCAGDSITEALRLPLSKYRQDLFKRKAAARQASSGPVGASNTNQNPRQHRLAKLYYGAADDWNPHCFAISGDSTQHLLWRLQNGGLPPQVRAVHVRALHHHAAWPSRTLSRNLIMAPRCGLRQAHWRPRVVSLLIGTNNLGNKLDRRNQMLANSELAAQSSDLTVRPLTRLRPVCLSALSLFVVALQSAQNLNFARHSRCR
eukprot:SAG11_NODE_134_length_15338_cov_3.876435_2_plen_238_part_00